MHSTKITIKAILRLTIFFATVCMLAVWQPQQASAQYSIVHVFGDGSVQINGAKPGGFMQATDGNFYGVTNAGGSSDKGIVYRMTPSGSTIVLHNFSDGSVQNDGAKPY